MTSSSLDRIGALADELDYTQDTLSTLSVLYTSLQHAYETCALPLHPARLDAMEKELLVAFDDLELQLIHLDRHLRALESSWYQWKSSHLTAVL
ncbi:hypothetical protein [Absidia glauca]|uniref:Uncharacterized protein n=1 Tax=Absidia glauca TaxID=4829 RepID=A0A163JF87_ABSGL|nr:hypothetical protein [Absidia glauca]